MLFGYPLLCFVFTSYGLWWIVRFTLSENMTAALLWFSLLLLVLLSRQGSSVPQEKAATPVMLQPLNLYALLVPSLFLLFFFAN